MGAGSGSSNRTAARPAILSRTRTVQPGLCADGHIGHLISVCGWVKAGAIGEYLLRIPTHRCLALCHIPPIEARSP